MHILYWFTPPFLQNKSEKKIRRVLVLIKIYQCLKLWLLLCFANPRPPPPGLHHPLVIVVKLEEERQGRNQKTNNAAPTGDSVRVSSNLSSHQQLTRGEVPAAR